MTGITLYQEADRSALQSVVSIKEQQHRQVEKRTASFLCCSSLEIGFRLLQALTLFSQLSLLLAQAPKHGRQLDEREISSISVPCLLMSSKHTMSKEWMLTTVLNNRQVTYDEYVFVFVFSNPIFSSRLGVFWHCRRPLRQNWDRCPGYNSSVAPFVVFLNFWLVCLLCPQVFNSQQIVVYA